MKIKSSAPGRICLFGEHQDYLGFPVIAAAIDLTVTVEGNVKGGHKVDVELLDMDKKFSFDANDIRYRGKKDYLKSVIKVLKKKKLYKNRRIKASITGNVPIQAGTSSSAAFVTAWTGFVLEASGKFQEAFGENGSGIGELVYQAEVTEFGESGGRMDQYASAIGGIVYLDFYKQTTAYPLPIAIREFVLGDSHQPKDTQKTLKRVRSAQESAFRELAGMMKFEDNFHVTYDGARPYLDRISEDRRPYLRAALRNHEITNTAAKAFAAETPDIQQIADLMNDHQQVLRDDLNVSTPKIDTMIEKSLLAGALAGKVNGSGEGGCMFAFCPGKQEEVAEAIRQEGGTPYIINIGPGVTIIKQES